MDNRQIQVEAELAIKALNTITQYFISEVLPSDQSYKNTTIKANGNWRLEDNLLKGGVDIHYSEEGGSFLDHPFYKFISDLGFIRYCGSYTHRDCSAGVYMGNRESFEKIPARCSEYIKHHSANNLDVINKYKIGGLSEQPTTLGTDAVKAWKQFGDNLDPSPLLVQSFLNRGTQEVVVKLPILNLDTKPKPR